MSGFPTGNVTGTLPLPPSRGPMPPGGLLGASPASLMMAGSGMPGAIPPMPPIPGLMPSGMQPQGLNIGSEQMLAYLVPQRPDTHPRDTDLDLPPAMQRYAAGLRPASKPSGVPWQQEIIFERLGKEDREIEAVAQYYFKIAMNYDMYLSRERITASQYYAGRPLGDETPGRSQIVMTVVRDTIRSTLPSLLRVFTGVEDPVAFEPISSEITGNDQLATTLSRQATDYTRWALFTANPGWQILHDVLLDALTRKAGWVRWYWGKREQVRTDVCEGLLMPQLQMLLSQPGIEAQRIVRRPMTQEEQQTMMKTPDGAMYLQSGAPAEMWAATITRTAQQNWPCVEAVPSECVWVVADADTVADTRGIFHVRDVPASDLIEMGLPADKVLSYCDTMMRPQQRREIIARDPAQGYNIKPSPPGDRSMSIVRYAEGWIRCDADNDNKAELLHVHMLGNATRMIQWERVDEIPLACFTPYREPGRLIGYSQADMVMDLQRVESRVMRATLDSLAQSMFPRTVVTLGQVNLADARQTAIGSIIRTTQPGAVTELTKPFAGEAAIGVMQVLEAIRESRTGITRASQGLTVDELQSTAPIAISQQTSAAQDRLDMMARTLAETGLAPLYSGLLKMMARHQDRPNVYRIRGQWIAIDPRALGVMWQTSVNVGGKGMPMERLAMLAQIAGKQEMIMQSQGLDNPLVGVPEYRNTLARMLETANIADVSSYFKALPPGFQPPPPQQQPNTDLILAQVQAGKTAADVENDRASEQTKRAQMLTDDDLKRDQAALDAWTKAWVAGAQFGTPVPSLTEFQQAMASRAPKLALLGNLPPPTSPQPPATAGPAPGQQPPQGPQRPPAPGGGSLAPNASNPMMPPRPMQPTAPPAGSFDPASAMATRQALMGGRMPTAYGQIATRAAGQSLFGPGGPPIPRPGGPPAPLQ